MNDKQKDLVQFGLKWEALRICDELLSIIIHLRDFEDNKEDTEQLVNELNKFEQSCREFTISIYGEK